MNWHPYERNRVLCFVGGPEGGPRLLLSLNRVSERRVRGGTYSLIDASPEAGPVEVAAVVDDVISNVIVPSANRLGLKVTRPRLGPNSVVQPKTMAALVAFSDVATGGGLPLSEASEAAWRKFLITASQEDVAFDRDELRDWFVSNGWVSEDAAHADGAVRPRGHPARRIFRGRWKLTDMPDVAAAAAHIKLAVAPVVFLDTCVLLDVVRAPLRNAAGDVEAATEVLKGARRNPPTVYPVIACPTPTEWDAHIDEAVQDCENAVNSVGAVSASCAFVGLPALGPLPPALATLPDRLKTLSKNLLDASILLDKDSDALSRAIDRIINALKPARKGGQGAKDAAILEHAVSLVDALLVGRFPGPSRIRQFEHGRFREG